MKKVIVILLAFTIQQKIAAQSEKEKVEKACFNYIEGFYEGDTVKLISSLKPALYKFGYWKNKTSGNYEPDGNMTYREAIDYAKKVFKKKAFTKTDAIKKVEVLDIMNNIASAKVTAKWGVDYVLLARQDDKWMIEQVLWEGPLQM